jgi:hypothetical protein
MPLTIITWPGDSVRVSTEGFGESVESGTEASNVTMRGTFSADATMSRCPM